MTDIDQEIERLRWNRMRMYAILAGMFSYAVLYIIFKIMGWC